jgi:hypothetical protein
MYVAQHQQVRQLLTLIAYRQPSIEGARERLSNTASFGERGFGGIRLTLAVCCVFSQRFLCEQYQ